MEEELEISELGDVGLVDGVSPDFHLQLSGKLTEAWEEGGSHVCRYCSSGEILVRCLPSWMNLGVEELMNGRLRFEVVLVSREC